MKKLKFRAWDGSKIRTSFVIHNETGLPMIENNDRYLETVNWTIDQFTGQIDKNGKEIYERDIVHFWSNMNDEYCTGTIVFDNGSFCIEIKDDDDPYRPCLWEGSSYKVIGNVYESRKD